MTRLRLLLALGAAALSLATATAHANETEWNYHATICVPTSSSTSAVYNSFGVNNVSTTGTLTVACPLVTTLGTTAFHISSVHVSYFDRGATRLTCTVKNVDFAANVLYSASATSPGFNTGNQIFQFNPPSGNTTDSFWELECTIPAVNSGNFSAVTAMFMVAN
jgi:hypothetical protein